MAVVEVRDAEPREALAFLAALEAATGIPPVDEDEQRRLAGLPPVRDPDWSWGGHLVLLAGTPVAYAGIRMRPAGATGCAARVDLAIAAASQDRGDTRGALAAALDHLRSHAAGATSEAGSGVEAWLRGATDGDLAVAAGAGFHEHQRLHVLMRTAQDDVAPPIPAGLRLRAFDPTAPEDAAAVVGLLGRAYPELADVYAHRFGVLVGSDWFRAHDLLLLEEDGRLLALHWMKRRGEGVGEVYNLAVDPSAQGRGLGPLLLDVGLAHLRAAHCREVVLWVHASNTRALDLYRSRGFVRRWDDVSLAG